MKLDGVHGQQTALRRLSAELAAGRLAHAYLFVGPKGVGRATTARALFRAMNCLHPEGEVPCGHCDSCHRAKARVHEDLIVVEPPSDSASAQIKVDSVREVIRTLGFAPFSGGTRLVLIRECEHLNPSSGNALLKTLEEPPPNNVLVLTAQDPRELLPTLVSRCRKVSFGPLADELVIDELVARGVDPEAARLRTALAAGSLGRALKLDEEALAERLEQTRQALGSADAAGDWEFAQELVGGFRGARIDREGLVEALDLLALHFRDQAVAAAGRADLALVAGHTGPVDLQAASANFARVRRAQAQVLQNAAPELAVAMLMADLRAGGVE